MTFYTTRNIASSALPRRDDIEEVMRDWENRYSTYITTSIFITTFNVNGRMPALEDLSNWLTCGGVSAPDFYVIGLQEMDLSPQAFLMNTSARHSGWQIIIQKSLPTSTGYILIQEVRLVGILLVIYRRIDCKVRVEDAAVDVEVVPTGFPLLGRMGNKGGVAVSLQINDSYLCFVNSHFAAGQEELEKRNQDYREISQIRFPKSNKSLFDHDVIFWFGDMNFRLETNNDLSTDDFRRLCADENAFRDMIVFDQLKNQKKLNHIFVDFKEPDVLNFRPTYKYDPGTTRWDTSEKCRCPAWCDRILWWNRDGVNVRQQFYESVESVVFSDHKPVRSIFHVEIRNIDEAKRDACLEEAIREADRRANEALPQIELSQSEVDFGKVYFFQSASKILTIKNTGKTKISFSFGARPNRAALCEPWLSVTPPNSRLQPGACCTISLQILIDKAVAWTMSEDGKLSEILVLRLHHGRHYFVTVSAQYQHSAFGSSFIQLIRKEKKETSASELVNLTFSSTSLVSAVMAGVPESVFRISETLKQNGLEKISFNGPSAHSEFIALRNALDTGKPTNLFENCKSPFSMYDTLLTLITSFKESIIPLALQTECLRAAGDINSCWSCIEKFPVENRNMFIYFIGFVTELMERNSTANTQIQLLADVIFKQPAGDDGYLQRLKFLETFVSENREGSRSTQSLPTHCQHDADLIVL
ncbi:endonuclease/Exonuclease/phosphatase [Loa loa]|uniref:Endonuclease/Exonuclease/phosphatase n=1 Tax=Loa loa TaxID=7209 RepID=A0A1I7VE63_LOALO|nr:endonuclease/Exonuclease/phosphatase [Loa loa]EFO28046.2 endonuclease/Exonuclease/phosphatase [Loa loa]